MRNHFLVRWMAIGSIGTLLGLGTAGFVGLMGLATGDLVAAITAALVFGAAIGVTIGLAQGMVLSSRIERLSATRWAAHTAVGASLAWAAVAWPIARLATADVDPTWTERLLWAAAMGLVAGAIVGIVQWRELERVLAGSRSTVAAQAVGWMAGALVLAVVDGVVRPDLEEAASIGVAAVGLTVAGGVVAAVQGGVLSRLLPRHTPEDDPLVPARH